MKKVSTRKDLELGKIYSWQCYICDHPHVWPGASVNPTPNTCDQSFWFPWATSNLTSSDVLKGMYMKCGSYIIPIRIKPYTENVVILPLASDAVLLTVEMLTRWSIITNLFLHEETT
jgi:hypothetical protein